MKKKQVKLVLGNTAGRNRPTEAELVELERHALIVVRRRLISTIHKSIADADKMSAAEALAWSQAFRNLADGHDR